MKYENISIIIPSYEPTVRLNQLVDDLIKNGFENIIVVNDGSGVQFDHIYDALPTLCTVIQHDKNIGKGGGLKNSFTYILHNEKNIENVITIDCDGQHTVQDILKVAKAVCNNHQPVLGYRTFHAENVPVKSLVGNTVTRIISRIFNLNLRDTQTGLRGIPVCYLEDLIQLEGNRFEYEMSMLFYFVNHNIHIMEIPIQTLYYDQNSGSHYRPFQDSMLIVKEFFKQPFAMYLSVAVLSFCIEIILFTLLSKQFTGKIYYRISIANYIARAISLIFNFICNKKAVFHANGHTSIQLVKYLCLVFMNVTLSSIIIEYLYRLSGYNESLIKIVVDLLLFAVNYHVQRRFIFK